jgi:hypothetical protein
MQTAYLNLLNHTARDNTVNSFQAPHPRLDIINGPLIHLAENTAAVHAFINRTSILSPKGDKVTSMRPVNTITDYVSVVRLNDEIRTKFDDTKPVMEKEQVEQEQEQAQEQSQERHHARLLNISDLEYLGLLTTYLRTTGKDDPNYTVMGAPIDLPLTNEVQRHIRQVFLWDESTMHRVNTTLMSVLNIAFDMTPLNLDLVDNLYAMHGHQTVKALMYNRAQGNKVSIMNFGSSLGYRPTPTGADVLRLMKDLRNFSLLINIFTEQPLFPTNALLIQQVLDGLLRMVHLLPEHVRPELHTSLQIFLARYKIRQTILPMAVLISAGAIVQQNTQIDQGVTPTTADVVFPGVEQLPASPISHPTATAMVVRTSAPDRQRVTGPPPQSSGARRNDRSDPTALATGRDHRLATERSVATQSASNVTLADLQRTMAALQSQVDRQARLARRDVPDDEQPPARCAAYYIRATGPPEDSASSDEEPPATAKAFGARVMPDDDDKE